MRGNNPLISVIIPAYNHEQFVQETIRSIIAQTYQNLELIIIDDGSTDSTWAKIQEMRKECENRFVRIDFSTQENCGSCITGNKIKEKARGKYTYSIASDDVAYPNAIENLYEATINDNCVLVVGNEDFIDADGNKIGVDEHFNPQPLKQAKYKTFCDYYDGETTENYYKSENFGSYKSFLKRNYVPNGYLVLASSLKSFSYTPNAPLEDWFMHMQLSKMGKYKFVNKILFSYRLHGHNTIANKEHLGKMSQKTIDYEEKVCENNPKWRHLFRISTISKYYINLGFIQIYKRKFFGNKLYYLYMFGKEFIIKNVYKNRNIKGNL